MNTFTTDTDKTRIITVKPLFYSLQTDFLKQIQNDKTKDNVETIKGVFK